MLNSLVVADPGLTVAALRVGVKALCRFTAQRGDLDRRFTPAPSGRQGVEGHAIVAARRGPDYRAEIALATTCGSLVVRGRADGYLPAKSRLEEFKTHLGPVERIPDNHRALHWAQVQTYGAMLCAQERLPALTLALVYFDIGTQRETVLEEHWTAAQLGELFRDRCERFGAWAESEALHRRARNASLDAMRFPFEGLHAEQRLLAEAVYRAAVRGDRLLAEAPTGVGKTLGSLFPTLKAMATDRLDKIYYLTAKTTGRALAIEALASLARANGGLTLRVLDLVARERCCAYPDRECHGRSCPLARGFHDRLPAARAEAARSPVMDHASLRAVADAHAICPYYLAQEMIRWADVVVADYNHYFDASAVLHALTKEEEWRVGVLVDEAHNLVPRGRDMYSTKFAEDVLQAALSDAPASLRASLRRVADAWTAFRAQLPAGYAVLDDVPESLLESLRDAAGRMSEWSAAQVEPLPAAVLSYHFDALEFLRLADSIGAHSLLEWTPSSNETPACVGIRNLVPAPFLANRFDAAKSVVLFSATLGPSTYYQAMFGLQNCRCLTVDSPFEPEQLDVRIVTNVSTRFRHRSASVAPIVELVSRQFRRAPGNYLLFAGGFEYLRQIEAKLRAECPDIPVWTQTPRMSEADREKFGERFTESGEGIGLAVLGGAFGEGIDLPGSRLIGAFVLTLGLPPVDDAHEEMRKRLEQSDGRGYEYTYLYPGLQRVVQAAGRVIRSTTDRGHLFLIDDRFAQPAVARLLPAWWATRPVTVPLDADA